MAGEETEQKERTKAVRWAADRVYGYDENDVCIETIEHPVRTMAVAVLPVNSHVLADQRATIAQLAEANASLRQQLAEAQKDAGRYQYMKQLSAGRKGVLRVSYVDGDKDRLLMAVVTERADEFIDAAKEGK